MRAFEPFLDRAEAGRLLADAIVKKHYAKPVVLALPRGGVPVALEVAKRLHAPLDLVLVRKLGVPFQPELAAGAVVDGAVPKTVYNDDVITRAGLTRAEVDDIALRELREIDRRRDLYLKDRARAPIAGRTAIVVDDGLATGATARAALHALRRKKPARLVLAVPVAPPDTIAALKTEADETVCLSQPEDFYAIGAHYLDFRQLSDEDVIDLLAAADALSGERPDRTG